MKLAAQSKFLESNVSAVNNFTMSFNDELGDQSLAKEYLDRASAILLKKLGSENVEFASSFFNLCIVHDKLGDLSNAIDHQ